MSKPLRYICAVLFLAALGQTTLQGAPLKNVPVTVVQPGGDTLHIYASGDEFHNWLHDGDQYTIIQDPISGYYTYAVRSKQGIVSSPYIVGKADPKTLGLEKGVNISPLAYQMKREASVQSAPQQPAKTASLGTVNNLVIFIRFSGEAEFTTDRGYYDIQLNASDDGVASMYNFFREASYGRLSIHSAYYPTPNGGDIVSYQDTHPRAYYEPYNATTNPFGYTDADRWNRESSLLCNAIAYIAPLVPADMRLDNIVDGVVDNIDFVIKGESTGWSSLLWPHANSLNGSNVYINGKQVRPYNLLLETMSSVGTFCHEMGHILGAPDLYHYYSTDGSSPVGPWDLMASSSNTPQEIGAYIKSVWMQFLGGLGSIPEITRTGTYTLYPLATSTRCAYKIRSPYSSDQFFMVEFRNKVGIFDGTLPRGGLLVYRIYPEIGGNEGGPPDGVYIYRPGGTPTTNGNIYNAPLSVESGHTSLGAATNPIPFLVNGSDGGLRLSEVSTIGSQMTFKVTLPGSGAPPLLASYPLDDASAADSSGNRHAGTITGALPVADRFNSQGKALAFNGTDSKVTTEAFYGPVNNLSVSLWFKTDLVASSKYECLLGDGNVHQGFRIYHTPPDGDSLHFEIRGEDSWAQSVGFKLSAQDQGRWVHLAAVSICGLLKIYKNGVLQDSAVCPLGTSAQGFWTSSVGMGFESYSKSGFWTGALDDVRLYSCPLSDEEIEGLYHERGWPRTPVLLRPPDTATAASTSPTLTWHVPEGVPSSYRVQLSVSPGFETLAYDSSGITSPAHQLMWLSGATQYWWRVLASFAQGDTVCSALWSFTTHTGPYSGSPIALPGMIEAEAFDAGGEGVGYHDLDGENQGALVGSRCRSCEGVDTEPCQDPQGGAFNLAWTRAGEWLRYTVVVAQTGLYQVELRVATPSAGRVHLEVDGMNISGPIGFGSTGGWQSWASVRDSVLLFAGEHELRLVFDDTAGAYHVGNVNRMQFTRLAPLERALDLLVSGSGGGMNPTLGFGFAPGASNGLDEGLGEAVLANVPGTGVFDARFMLPTTPAIGSLTDLRRDTNEATVWRLALQPGASGYLITFRWTSPSGALSGGLRLEDELGGSMVDVDMELDTAFALSNANVTSLQIRYSPVARPNLIAPENGAANVSALPLLSWRTAREVPSFRLELGTDSLLEDPLVVDTTLSGATSFAVVALAHDRMYWWRACAVSGDASSEWTPPWHFRTIVELPAALAQVSPLDQATVGTDSVRFSWHPGEPSVTRYWFEVAADSQFKFSVSDSSLTDTATIVHGLSNGQSCWWKVAAGNIAGWGPFSSVRSFKVLTTDISRPQPMPTAFSLAQNFPNPFNPTTTVEYDVPRPSRVRIGVYDLLGREVVRLVDGTMEAGHHRLTFDAEDLASGVYVVRMQADAFSDSKKIVLLR